MKCGIEARHLRHIGLEFAQGPDCRQVVRLVQRRQRHQLFQLVKDRTIDDYRRRKSQPTMDHPVANPENCQPIRVAVNPREQDRQDSLMVSTGTPARQRFVYQMLAIRVRHEKAGTRSDSFD